MFDIGYLLPQTQPERFTKSDARTDSTSISGCFAAVVTTVMPSQTAPKNPHIETASAASSEPFLSE
jgi:alpha-acetolactate decarboxylase